MIAPIVHVLLGPADTASELESRDPLGVVLGPAVEVPAAPDLIADFGDEAGTPRADPGVAIGF